MMNLNTNDFGKWFDQYENNNEYAAKQIALDAYQQGLKQCQNEIDDLNHANDLLRLKVSALESKLRVYPKYIKMLKTRLTQTKEQADELQDKFEDLKEYFDLQEYIYQGDAYNRGWNSALNLIQKKLAEVLKGNTHE